MFDFDSILSGNGQDGQVPFDQIAGLRKAMTAGTGIATPGSQVAGAAAPIIPESLEAYLSIAIEQAEDLPMMRAIGPYKEKALSPTEQWNTLEGVGADNTIFNGEVALPDEQDSSYVRRTIELKPMGVTGRVSFRAQAARTIAGIDSVMAQEVENKTLFMLRNIERAIFVGDSSIIPEQFDGLGRQIAAANPENVFDARGALLTRTLINRVAKGVRRAGNYGRLNTLFCSVNAYADLTEDVTNASSVNRANYVQGTEIIYGVSAKKILTSFGVIDLIYSQFLVEGTAPATAGTVALRPATPLANGAVVAAPAAGSQFAAADAGDYIYAIVGLSARGQSTTLQTAVVTVAAGDGVTIPIADGGNGTTGYIVYRSTPNGAASTLREAFRVARTGANQNIVDLNAALPGTSTAYLLSLDPRSIAWSELTPLTKFDLATVDTSNRFLLYTDAGLKVRTARKHAVIQNIGIANDELAPAGPNWVA